MRAAIVSIGLSVIAAATGTGSPAAFADCACPAVTLEDRIAGAAYIFSGKPLMFAQIPPGGSPFHSESSLEAPGGVANDIVTMFQVDTVWKGEALRRVKVRRSPGACAADFKIDDTVIVFAQADSAGILWTGACSGDAVQGDGRYDALKLVLTGRLKYD